jgi:nickel-dependent lactate racemase
MRIALDYGRDKLPVEVPDRHIAEVLSLGPEPALPDPEGSVEEALAAPVGAAPLGEIARGRRSACVVISDRTRPIPYHQILPPILATLGRAGVPRDRTLLLVATGLHRAATEDEIRSMLGPGIAGAYRVESHDGRDHESHSFLGHSAKGTPIAIDRRYVEADLKILTGLIEPHLMAGYSGGRKAICPGLASLEMMRVEHGPKMLEGSVGNGILEGNPFHEDILDIARRTGADFIVNCTVNREKRLTGVYAGDLELAFMAGVDRVAEATIRSIASPVEVALTSGGGFPLDATFYQSIKGMIGCLNVLRPGGTIVIATRISEGVGSADFQRLLSEAESAEGFMRRLFHPDFFVPDQWMVQHLCQVLRRASVIVVSEGLSEEKLADLLVESAPTAEAGVQRALARQGPEARVAVVPEGPYVLPTVGGALRPIASP